MGKLIFALKKVKNFKFFLLGVFVLSSTISLTTSKTFANAPVLSETPDVTIYEQYRMALEQQKYGPAVSNEYVDPSSIEEAYKKEIARANLNPIDYQNYSRIYNNINNNPYREKTFSEADKQLLLNYYRNELMTSGDLTKYHEENYFYTDGQVEKSIYNGVIGYTINDFDNDSTPELAIFKIRTNMWTENYAKEVVMDVIKLYNGLPQLFGRAVVLSDEFSAETIELDISVKRYNERDRIYINYFTKKVGDESVENKFLAIDVVDGIHIVAEANYNAFKEEYYYYDDNFNFTNSVLDAGISVKDDAEIINRAFINDDPNVKPITTLYRVNESLKDGYIEHYMEDYYEDFIKYGFLKIRYGYTNIMMR